MKRYVRISLIYNIMCSIIGYFGHDEASSTLVRGLGRMEYRGYDSVGVAIGSKSKIMIKIL
jgi:glucosamine--fructose-6-phosphate aminotransferase (isomerizing)